MNGKKVYHLNHAEARRRAAEAIALVPDGYIVEVKPATRTLEQNAYQWPILQAFAEQLQWPVNGQMVHMSAEEWKDLLTAAFRGETLRLAMALDGRGVVSLGQRTSKFNKKEFSEWQEFLTMVAAERGVEYGY